MDYKTFKAVVQKKIIDYLPEEKGNKVHIEAVKKNNGVVLDSMTIIGDQAITPSLYLNQYYDQYLQGKSMVPLLVNIAMDYKEAKQHIPQGTLEFEYEKIKDNIFVAACNAEKNQELLEDVPHELCEDVALIYKVRCQNFENATIQIKNSHLKMWGIDEQMLKTQAWESMKKELPAECMGMAKAFEMLTGIPLPDEAIPYGKEPLYVLTNQEKLYGAAYMFDQETMEKIAAELGGNLIVLPSSLHEVIIVKETEDVDLQELKDMVSGINETVVSEEEFLSDEIYRYDAEQQTLSVIDDFSSQQMGMRM